MPIRTTVKVEGLRQLGVALKNLDQKVARRASRGATAAAAAVIKKAAKGNIRKSPSIETGSLLKSVIAKRLGKGETNLTSEHIVTVRGRGKKKKDGTLQESAPHAHLVEFGTVKMPAEPFLRPAYESEKHRAAAAIADKLRAAIAKAAK